MDKNFCDNLVNGSTKANGFIVAHQFQANLFWYKSN